MIKLYFLRHAHATWPDWSGPDDERPITKKGKKETRAMAKFLEHIGAVPEAVFSSPLPRAVQTAEIAARVFGTTAGEDAGLKPGFDAEKLANLLTSAREKHVDR